MQNKLNFWKSDEPTGRLALVFELMEKNIYEHIKGSSSIDLFLI